MEEEDKPYSIDIIKTKAPARIMHAGTYWFATGRRGTYQHIWKDLASVPVAEYECGDTDRVWAEYDGTVVADYEVCVCHCDRRRRSSTIACLWTRCLCTSRRSVPGRTASPRPCAWQ